MPNSYFQFKQFRIEQDKTAMKVCTDSCLFGAWLEPSATVENILDIGTGTGLLSLMLAQKMTGQIDAIDIEQDALEQAKVNIAASPWKHRIHLHCGDVNIYPFNKQYDLIICNPPFYEQDKISEDKKEIMAKHSSHLTLSNLFGIAKKLLTENGSFALLLPYFRKDECINLAVGQGLFLQKALYMQQTPEHSEFRFAGIFSTQKKENPILETIQIRDISGAYTDRFTQLLQPYYLYF